MRLLLGVGIGEVIDGAGFLSKRSIWVLNGGRRLTLLCGLIVTADGYGRCASGSILGLGMSVEAGLDMGIWLVGTSLEVWQWGGQRQGLVDSVCLGSRWWQGEHAYISFIGRVLVVGRVSVGGVGQRDVVSGLKMGRVEKGQGLGLLGV